MRLLGVVILYYPDANVQANILSYLDFVEELIIWDNTPEGGFVFNSASDFKIKRMGIGENMGLGYPLNEAVNYGISKGFTHLLTMDQDSSFDNNFSRYLDLIGMYPSADIAAYSINYSKSVQSSSSEASEINICITSGTVYPLSIFSEIGLFRDDFFIDSIDTEFCLRALKYSKKILYFPSILMKHQLGYHTYYKFLWGRLGTPDYSAFRTYYIVRNMIILKRIYKFSPDNYIDNSLRELFCRRFLRICLVEKDKFNKIKYFSKAIVDGFTESIYLVKSSVK